jgi:hypothetical protein
MVTMKMLADSSFSLEEIGGKKGYIPLGDDQAGDGSHFRTHPLILIPSSGARIAVGNFEGLIDLVVDQKK